MAHLARCWCGRLYRCEQDHRLPPNVLRCFDIERHDRCPDFLFHGPQTIEFKTVTMPVIRTAGEWPSIADLFKEN